MKALVVGVLLLIGTPLLAEVVRCPALKQRKPLTDGAFFEGSSPTNKTALRPEESRVDGEDWFQTWDVTHVNEDRGLQMVCKYQGVREGTFIMIKKATLCTLTKKAGHVEVGCK